MGGREEEKGGWVGGREEEKGGKGGVGGRGRKQGGREGGREGGGYVVVGSACVCVCVSPARGI